MLGWMANRWMWRRREGETIRGSSIILSLPSISKKSGDAICCLEVVDMIVVSLLSVFVLSHFCLLFSPEANSWFLLSFFALFASAVVSRPSCIHK